MYVRPHVATQLATEHIDALRESRQAAERVGRHRRATPLLSLMRRRPSPTPATPTQR